MIDLVAPGTPPLGQPPGLTPARASLPRGLTPDPGAAHGGEDGSRGVEPVLVSTHCMHTVCKISIVEIHTFSLS